MIWVAFEKRASENRFEKPLAPMNTTLGVLRPLKSDLSRRQSGLLSRRTSSLVGSVDGQVDEMQRKLDAMNTRVCQLEVQFSELEKKLHTSDDIDVDGN